MMVLRVISSLCVHRNDHKSTLIVFISLTISESKELFKYSIMIGMDLPHNSLYTNTHICGSMAMTDGNVFRYTGNFVLMLLLLFFFFVSIVRKVRNYIQEIPSEFNEECYQK